MFGVLEEVSQTVEHMWLIFLWYQVYLIENNLKYFAINRDLLLLLFKASIILLKLWTTFVLVISKYFTYIMAYNRIYYLQCNSSFVWFSQIDSVNGKGFALLYASLRCMLWEDPAWGISCFRSMACQVVSLMIFALILMAILSCREHRS